jgi:hypothetical protein
VASWDKCLDIAARRRPRCRFIALHLNRVQTVRVPGSDFGGMSRLVVATSDPPTSANRPFAQSGVPHHAEGYASDSITAPVGRGAKRMHQDHAQASGETLRRSSRLVPYLTKNANPQKEVCRHPASAATNALLRWLICNSSRALRLPCGAGYAVYDLGKGVVRASSTRTCVNGERYRLSRSWGRGP